MKTCKFVTIAFLGVLSFSSLGSEINDVRNLQPLQNGIVPARPEAIKRWRDLRFGMFIHWGPVALTGKEIGWSRGKQIPVETYDNLYKRFNPVKFNADEWVSIAKAAGMKYIVLTTKHHDGFCLWDSAFTDYDIMSTPFKRDIVRELSEACKRQGIAFGAYYSTCDWYHPDFPLTSPGGRVKRATHNLDRYTDYMKSQSWELLTKYGPLICMWHDVGQMFDAKRGAGVINLERAVQPDILVNERTRHPGDFSTPEQRVGRFNMERPWETCMTICRQWAWKPKDKMKSLKTCIHTFLRTIGCDGNFLFNVGPQPDGLIEARQVKRLKEMGEWISRHSDAIYATRGGPWMPSSSMVSTRRGDKIYLIFLKKMTSPITLLGLPYEVKSAKTLSDSKNVRFENGKNSLRVFLDDCAWDGIATIVELNVAGDSMLVDILPSSTTFCIPGSKASASSVFADKKEYSPDKAIDGDSITRWATPTDAYKSFLRIDFPETTSISGIEINEVLFEKSSRVLDWKLEKLDGEKWTTIYSGKGIGSCFKTVFNPISTKAIRINILKATKGPTISEVNVIR